MRDDSPAPSLTPEVHAEIMAEIVLPTVAGMKARGTPFRGVLYAGVSITPAYSTPRNGVPRAFIPATVGRTISAMISACTSGVKDGAGESSRMPPVFGPWQGSNCPYSTGR